MADQYEKVQPIAPDLIDGFDDYAELRAKCKALILDELKR